MPIPYTQMPNVLLDEHLPSLSGAEFKVAAIVVRYTAGFHRRRHRMSLSFFEAKTGLTRETVSKALQALIAQGVIARRRAGSSYAYELLVGKPDQPLAGESDKPTPSGQKSPPKPVEESDSMKETIKQTSLKEIPCDGLTSIYEQQVKREAHLMWGPISERLLRRSRWVGIEGDVAIIAAPDAPALEGFLRGRRRPAFVGALQAVDAGIERVRIIALDALEVGHAG